MKNVVLSNLVCMFLILLLVSGCQKDEKSLSEYKVSRTFQRNSYKPVFDTITKNSNSRNTQDTLPYQAPTTEQLWQLEEDLKTVGSNHNVARNAILLRNSGSRLSSDYAVIFTEQNPDNGHIITIPFANTNEVTGILLYVKTSDDQFFTNVYTKTNIEDFVNTAPGNPDEIYMRFQILSAFTGYQYVIENKADSLHVKWLEDHKDIVSRRPPGRCQVLIHNIPVIAYYTYVPSRPDLRPVYTWEWVTTHLILCAHDHNGYIGPGAVIPLPGAGSNNPNIVSTLDVKLNVKFPALDTDCLRLLQNDVKEELLNSISPCNQDLFNSQITQAFNDACNEAKQNGGDDFLMNVEIWEFTQTVKNAMQGMDYIINNITNTRINCFWKKLMNSNNNVICEQISYYEGKTKLNLKIYSQDLNGQNAITWFDDRDGNPYISFDEDLSTKCDIEIIKTMIHESVHAGILNVVKGTHAAGWGVNNIPELKYYMDNFSNFHHEYMAGAYFNELVEALKQFFGNEYTDLEYEAIMWSGLHNTSSYRKLSESKRIHIENIWDQFKNSNECKKTCLY